MAICSGPFEIVDTLELMNMDNGDDAGRAMGLLQRVPQNRALPGNHTFSNPLYKKSVQLMERRE